ncbi:hypothetical protein DFQ27_002683 [Actinomortierella ambigua]|uniref:Uncharacterized protein n=1 Tax=Actinomortierella ambigua TaxID=1343610 RepID=A0A9P6Q805_9FUNG|nr:hypothetical protein DFQ27_002683 [Actinomortierella ambigua]
MSSNPWSPPPLIPPFRFGTVELEVYRGAYPKQRNLRFLKRLKLRTVLSLIPDAMDDDFLQFCEEQGIRWIHLPVDKVKDNVPLTYSRTVEAIQVIINPDNMPIYIHCLDGAYLRGGVISSEESVFVEKFCSEIEISRPIPPWLWEGQINFKRHPTLKITFKRPPEQLAAINYPRYSADGGAVGVRGAIYNGSQSSSSPYHQEHQQQNQHHSHHHHHQQQQHVAFAASGPHPGSGRPSRHHHSSSSVSSVLGFQSLSDGGAGSSFRSFSPIPETSLSTSPISPSATPPPIAAASREAGDAKDTKPLEGRDTSALASGPGAQNTGSAGSQQQSSPTSASTSQSGTTANDPLYPRLSRTKSSIRTELGSQRPTTVSTPTMASMMEARARRPSLLHGLPAAATTAPTTLATPAAPTSIPLTSGAIVSASATPSSLASSMSPATASSPTMGLGGTGAASQGTAATRGVSHANDRPGHKENLVAAVSSPTLGEGTAASGAPGSDVLPARVSPLPTHANEPSSTALHAPTATHRGGGAGDNDARGSSNTEADEYYYDVSLTLKALSLEGADW